MTRPRTTIAIIGFLLAPLLLLQMLFSREVFSAANYIRLPYYRDGAALQIRQEGNELLLRVLTLEQNYERNIVPFGEDIKPKPIPPASIDARPIITADCITNVVTIVSGERWDKAVDSISDCQAQANVILDNWDRQNYSLFFKGKQVATTGRTVLQTALSPTSAYLAVLSASSRVRKPLIPFVGSDAVSRPRYHQVFRTSDGTPLGEPVLLENGNTLDNTVAPCWAPDERYVLYAHMRFDEIWLARFDVEGH